MRGPGSAFAAAARRTGWTTQAARSIAIGACARDPIAGGAGGPLREICFLVKPVARQSQENARLEKRGQKYNLQSLSVDHARAAEKAAGEGRRARGHRARTRGT